MMHEETAEFGENKRLFGILTHPENRQRSLNRPGIIIFNAGLVHRVGPFRFQVDLARQFSRKGFYTLRFDFSGLGDSKYVSGGEGYEKFAVSDAFTAMSYLTAKAGVTNFVLLGMCSGADMLHAVAIRDERVAGGVFLDAYGFPTKRFYSFRNLQEYTHYLRAIVTPGKWVNLFHRALKRSKVPTRMPDSRNQADVDLSWRIWPTQNQAEADIQSMIKRRVRLLYVYSGGVKYYYNYSDQFYDMFPSLTKTREVKVKYFGKADHTYTIMEQRRQLLACVGSWVDETF